MRSSNPIEEQKIISTHMHKTQLHVNLHVLSTGIRCLLVMSITWSDFSYASVTMVKAVLMNQQQEVGWRYPLILSPFPLLRIWVITFIASWPCPALGVSRRDLQKRLSCWLTNQHGAQWRGLGDTQRQAQELISGPSLGTREKFMTFNRIQSRAVIGLLMGHNTLRRHLDLLGLHGSRLYRKCGTGEETSAHILCECKSLASLRHAHLGSFFLEPEDIKSLGLEAIWNYCRAVGLPWFNMGHKGPVHKA